MDCIVLTYTIPHRKTYDVLTLLKAKGYHHVFVYAIPMHYQKKYYPLLTHRPGMHYDISPQELAKNLGYKFISKKDYHSLFEIEPHKILVAGAGILPEKLTEHHSIINAHPGYLPNVRGLDSLKWAIYEGQPIGVTTHFIGNMVDAGWIIEKKSVPVFFNDTFHAVAQRQYEMEIHMLVHALKLECSEYTDGESYPIHKRMPHALETRILERFEEIKKKVDIQSIESHSKD